MDAGHRETEAALLENECVEWTAGENKRRGGRDSPGPRGGGEDAFIYGGIALTAVWQRRPRQCLLEF